MSTTNFLGKWTRKCGTKILNVTTFSVFLFLDFLDVVLCPMYRLLDEFLEGKSPTCYCGSKGDGNEDNYGERELSESLYERENIFRENMFSCFARKWDCRSRRDGCGGEGKRLQVNRWSDCGCESCVSWIQTYGFDKLHVAVRELPEARIGDSRMEASENVIFVHGFLSSSSFWTETIFKNLNEAVKSDEFRLFAVDLLGFGRSPKPRDSMYTLSDHVEMIHKSVISPYQLKSFHVVAHSMGCIVAVALAAKYSKLVKSVTIVAPPYFSAKDGANTSMVLKTLAGKRLWPPSAFGKSLMSWYEHVGRCFCFFFCRNHRIWERIIKLLTRRRKLSFIAEDFSRHTHYSGWLSMHNVICGGAKFMDDYLEILNKSKVKICVIHGDRDTSVPLECSNNMKNKFPAVELNIVQNAGHRSVILRRKKEFSEKLQHIWASS